ncbi:MAG TPA: DUF4115 domain-containing protein [Acidimicrobiales bacterium]|nr:DUF4115 domain-containing protein [Acidimicrobiales bacterium]
MSENAEHPPFGAFGKGHRLPLGVGHGARKGASIAAAIVALAAIGVGTWQITSSSSPSPRALKQSTVTQPTNPNSSIPHSPTGRVTNHEITPVSQSGNLITYPLTSQSFTIKFISSGACWIGVRQGLNGTYLWMTTLGAGGTATYQASGPVYVRIGAPKYARVQINGVALALPPHVVTPYDITFSIGGSVSA